MEILVFSYTWVAVGVLSGLLIFFWSDEWTTLGHLLAWIFVGVAFGYTVVIGVVLYFTVIAIEKSVIMDWLNIELKEPKEKDILDE